MPRKRWEPATPDPGFKPGGLRESAWRAMAERGPRPEDPEKTKRSQEHWGKFRAGQKKRTGALRRLAGVFTPGREAWEAACAA